MAMAVDLWRRNLNLEVSKQSLFAKMLSVCLFFSQVSPLHYTADNAFVQDGTESFWLYVLF